MATGMSVTLRNAILNQLFGATDFPYTHVHISLHTADPGVDGSSEAAGHGYARQDGTGLFAAAAAGAIENDTEITFLDMPAVTVTYVGLWSAAAAGDWLWGGLLGSSRTFQESDFGTFSVGELIAALT
jgi:hypothetical protein